MKHLILGAALSVAATAAQASLLTFDWAWEGSDGRATARGSLAYDASLAGTGLITAPDIADFSIEGLLDGVVGFSWDLSVGTTTYPFQLSFDTNAEDLVFGGLYPTATDSVVWGDVPGLGDGLICGTGSCGLYIDGSSYGWRGVWDKTQFTVTRASGPAPGAAVPEPLPAGLAGLALLGLAALRRIRGAHAEALAA
jgi:hypothetical protein